MVSILHNHCFIIFFLVKNTLYKFYYIFETGPARQVDQEPGLPGAETGPG
jgi:hypothetical protein